MEETIYKKDGVAVTKEIKTEHFIAPRRYAARVTKYRMFVNGEFKSLINHGSEPWREAEPDQDENNINLLLTWLTTHTGRTRSGLSQ